MGEVARKQVEERRRTRRAGAREGLGLDLGKRPLRSLEGDEAGQTRTRGLVRKGC